jgi:peptidoglycan/LPS O-acetylase OafA/YrhL
VSSLAYRADIDGLRAIAVTLVLLFHAHLGFTGGFVGVDLFFVLSGYLITGIVLRDLEVGTFRLSEFWTRRVRRLAPAALVMTLVTLAVGALVLFPEDFEELGKSAIAHPLMVANFFFWGKTGYFEGPADLKPLLHTWSLAVEEQFYLVYPLLLILLARLQRWKLFSVLAGLAAVSFAGSMWAVAHWPGAAFFLLPSRMWELLLGGLLWVLPSPARWPARAMQWLGIVGALALAVVAWGYTSATPFPGLAALPPCLATAAMIYANGHPNVILRTVLAWEPLVALGRMSYSLYLWHWPICVYLRYRFGDDFTAGPQLLAVVLSLVSGWLSWRYLETPFRQGAYWSSHRRAWSSFAVATTVVIACGWFVRVYDGLPGRFPPGVRSLIATLEAPRYKKTVTLTEVTTNRLPQFGDPTGDVTCLLWGDSHAMALVPVLDEVCNELKIRGFHATYSGTLPLVDFDTTRLGIAPEEYDEAVLDQILKGDFDLVLLTGYWSRDSDHPDFRPSLRETVAALLETGVRVVILRDVPIQEGGTGSLIAAPLQRGTNLEDLGVTLAEHREYQRSADEALIELAGEFVTLADPTPFLLDDTGRCRIVMNGECLYSDRHHLSLVGAHRLKPFFAKLLDPWRLDQQPKPPAVPVTQSPEQTDIRK